MKSIRTRLQAEEILIGDGAMGTQLYERGLPLGDCPESYNLSHPEILVEIATDFYVAGADIVQTNTFGGTPLKLAMYKLEKKVEEINRNAVSAVREAVGSNAYVSGSCGPTGKLLKPYGDTEAECVYDSFLTQIGVLIAAGVDQICIETMMDIEEAVLAIRAARALSRIVPVMATMTFNQTPRGYFTSMGNDVKTSAHRLEEAGADLIGSNCGNGIDQMVEIAAEFKRFSQLPILIQPNAGLPVTIDGEVRYEETPAQMAARIPALLAAGVSIIGGCCGTTPAHIKAFRAVVAG